MRPKLNNLAINISLLALLALAGVGYFSLISVSFIPSRGVVVVGQWLLPLAVTLAVSAKWRSDVNQFQMLILFQQFGIVVVLIPVVLLLVLLPCGWLATHSALYAVSSATQIETVQGKLISVHPLNIRRFSGLGGTIEVALNPKEHLQFMSIQWKSLDTCLGNGVEVHERRSSFGTIVDSVQCV